MNKMNGTICTPTGFRAAGVHAGLRKNPNTPDIAVIYSEVPATAAAVFTLNQIKAAPIVLTQQHIHQGPLQAVVVNSGNANACTGPQGMQHAKQMADTVAQELAIAPHQVAVASTGVIGVPLPINKVITGIRRAVASLSLDGQSTAHAIMTTDTRPKSITVAIKIDDKIVHIAGIAKGSGMVHPNMATILGFITTDAKISQPALQQALSLINTHSFNMITVDGETSTNDMVLVLANGQANNAEILPNTPDWQLFFDGLSLVCTSLAKQIAQDGEGATKLIEVHLHGAATQEQAQIAAKAVCGSLLVKAAIFGEDANWGRIACTLGACGVELDLAQLSIALDGLLLFDQGNPLPFDEARAKELLQHDTVIIKVNLGGVGTGQATAWGCDLTYDYVKINASYRS